MLKEKKKQCCNCDHHRKAVCDTNGDEKVACAFWSTFRPASRRNLELENSELDVAYEGWANLRTRPGKKKGLITNKSIVVNSKDSCEHYKEIV